MSEARLQSRCVKHARIEGCIAVKTDANSKAGMPDIMFLYDGRVLFIEFKNPNGKGRLRPMQVMVIDELIDLGFDVEVVDNWSVFREILSNFITSPK